jgi:hypothetical protein
LSKATRISNPDFVRASRSDDYTFRTAIATFSTSLFETIKGLRANEKFSANPGHQLLPLIRYVKQFLVKIQAQVQVCYDSQRRQALGVLGAFEKSVDNSPSHLRPRYHSDDSTVSPVDGLDVQVRPLTSRVSMFVFFLIFYRHLFILRARSTQ